MNIVARLPAAAAEHPDRPALIFAGATAEEDRRLSFAELDRRSARIASGLSALGIGRDAHVVILAPLSPELYAGLIALWRLGAIAVFLDPTAGRRALERAVALTAPEAIVAGPAARVLRPLSAGLRRIPLVLRPDGPGPRSLAEMARAGSPRPELAELDAEHPALITLTSGSTGSRGRAGSMATTARAILRSHGRLEAQHRSIASILPQQPGQVALTTFPVLVLHQLAGGESSLILGGPRFVGRGQRARRAARRAIEAMQRHGCHSAAAAPGFWRALSTELESGRDRPPLRRVVVGGAEVGAPLVERIGRCLPEAEILAVYGGTEAEPVACISAPEILARAERTAAGAGQPLGPPVPGIELRVLDTDGRVFPDGQPGEFSVRGDHVIASARAGDGGWHAMGDLGYRDADGELWLLGRAHTRCLQDGRSVYPVAVEAAVETLPFVERAVLVSIPFLEQAPGEDERLVLVMRPRAGANLPSDWRERLRERAIRAERVSSGGDSGEPAASGLRIHEILRLDRLPLDRRHASRVDHARLRRRLIDRRRSQHLRAWARERFPPVQHGLLIASYFTANALLAQAAVGRLPLRLGWREAAGGLALLCMFFLLRIIDEHKDFRSDRRVHPRRPLSRDLVTLPQLRRLGAMALLLELLLAGLLGPAALIAMLPILVLTVLIARDFFAEPFLERHMLFSAAIHLAIMPCYGLFVFSASTGQMPWSAPLPVLAYAWVGYALALAYELARKTRTPGEERPGLVTYSRRMGPFRPAWLALVAIAAGALLSLWAGSLIGLGAAYHVAVVGLVGLVGLVVLDYRLRPSPDRAARLGALAGLYIFAFDLLLAFKLLRIFGWEWAP